MTQQLLKYNHMFCIFISLFALFIIQTGNNNAAEDTNAALVPREQVITRNNQPEDQDGETKYVAIRIKLVARSHLLLLCLMQLCCEKLSTNFNHWCFLFFFFFL